LRETGKQARDGRLVAAMSARLVLSGSLPQRGTGIAAQVLSKRLSKPQKKTRDCCQSGVEFGGEVNSNFETAFLLPAQMRGYAGKCGWYSSRLGMPKHLLHARAQRNFTLLFDHS
jgi:hypothetical protein